MKKIFITVAAIIIATNLAFPQATNLQYSKVILVGSTEVTVPVGKVWKIENYLPTSRLSTAVAGGGNTSSTELIIVVNSNSVFVHTSDAAAWSLGGAGAANADATASGISFSPVWLPAGTTLKAGTGVKYISIIEFSEI